MDESTNAAVSAELTDFDRLWEFSNPVETERKFRALLPAAEASGDDSYWLQLATQIARAMGLQGKLREAHLLLDEIQDNLTDELPVAKVRYLLERGRVFNSSGEPGNAIPLFEEAWRLADAMNQHNFAIDAVHMLAIAERDRHRQVFWGQKGLELVAAYPSNERWLPALYNNLGETYRALGQYENALNCFEKLAEIDRNTGRPADMYTTKDIAKMRRLLGQYEQALALIEPVARDLKTNGKNDGYISAEYGKCLLAVGRADEALPNLKEAYDALTDDPYMMQHEPEELARLKRLAGAS